MKDHLFQLVQAAGPLQGRNILREYLQARILDALQRAGAMMPLAFQGGTSLRFLFALPRYSEDLDFTLEGDLASYDLRAYLAAIRAEFTREGYEVGLGLNDRRTVHRAIVRFRGLLYEAGLSPHQNEALTVQIDIDTNPPAGAVLETRLVRRHVTLRLQHHDRASLLAGKLHAILQRPYTKGRDLYDLIWYLSDRTWPAPNLSLLNAAFAADSVARRGIDGADLAGSGRRPATRSGVGSGGGRCASVFGTGGRRGAIEHGNRAAATGWLITQPPLHFPNDFR